MPAVKIFSVRSRLLVGAALAALLISACATSVPGTATPLAESSSVREAPSTRSAPSRSSGGCQVTASSSGSISSSGAGGRTSTVNGRTSFSCGRGPLIAIEAIDSSGVTFSADGTVVPVAPGASATVGAYRIEVVRADADSAQFQVEPAS
jgi:hypothetical protein